MILDRYTAVLRSYPRPPAPEPDPLLLAHDETKAVVESASAEMDQLTSIVERDRRGLSRARS